MRVPVFLSCGYVGGNAHRGQNRSRVFLYCSALDAFSLEVELFTELETRPEARGVFQISDFQI